MPTCVPVPATTTVDHVIEIGKASDVELTEEGVAEIDQTLAAYEVAGERNHPAGMKNHQLLELRSLFYLPSTQVYGFSAASKSHNLG